MGLWAAPAPFPDVVLVGVNEVKRKPIKVLDWRFIGTYYDDRGKWQHGGFCLIKLICEGRTVKIKATNPGMISYLKNVTPPFDSALDDGSGGLIFVGDKVHLGKAARRRWK